MKNNVFSSLILSLVIVSLFLTGCNSVSNETMENTASEMAESSETEEVTVVRLELVSPPDKTVYVIEEDTFDPTGMVLNAVMSDGSIQENVPWECDGPEALIGGDYNVHFTYEGKVYTQVIHNIHAGSKEEYAVKYTEVLEDSPLKGKTIFWLGSSVTYGSAAEGETMAEYIAHRHQCISIKEAVSGTTLATYKANSYVERLNNYLSGSDKVDHLDAFICQLSTNDQNKPEAFGIVSGSDVRAREEFDTETTFGAIEYIIATIQEEYDCPIFFYINPPTGKQAYVDMAAGLYQIADKWNIGLIDMMTDINFLNIPTEEQKALWMSDKIHPTRAGYRDWWTPKFESALLGLFEE